MYGKDAEKKNTNVAGRLGKPVNGQPAKGSHVIHRNQFAQKDEVEKTKFGPVSTASAPTTAEKKGPWAHLPPWKQRQLKAARAKQMAARQKAMAANSGAKKPVIKATPKPMKANPKPVARQPVRAPLPQIRRPGQTMNAASRKAPVQKPGLRRTPAPKVKSKKPSAAKPQMMKFSQWAEPTDAKLEEGEIVEIHSSVSDDDFAAMIATMDDKSDNFDSLIDDIILDASFNGPEQRYRLTDDEFDDFVSQLS